MIEVQLPFPKQIQTKDLKSFYFSFLIRLFVIKGEFGHKIRITKEDFSKAMKKQGWNRQRIHDTWKYRVGAFIKYECEDYVILQGKEAISNDGGFLTYVGIDDLDELSYFKFCKFIREVQAVRPVGQTEEFKMKYKFKKKQDKYNAEILRRSLAEKKGRGQRNIAKFAGCTIKTVNKTLKESKNIKTVKRYDSYNGFRIRKTNLYFTKIQRVFKSYNKIITGDKNKRMISLSPDHSSLTGKEALFLNGSISLYNSDDMIYKLKVLD